MSSLNFVAIAEDLELAGLLWHPEIGDEVSFRERMDKVSILVDPQGMTPRELRDTYLWLPTVEQIVLQFEARQAILAHMGLELSKTSVHYKTIVEYEGKEIESVGFSVRQSLGTALRSLLLVEHENLVQ